MMKKEQVDKSPCTTGKVSSAAEISHVSEQAVGDSDLSKGLSLNPDNLEASRRLSKGKSINVIVALVCSFALVGLDQNIVATSVPAIIRDFRTIGDIGWYNSIYRLTGSSFQPFFGKIYFLCSTRRVHLASLFLFGCGNLLSGLAPTSAAFIAGRALTGLSSAGVISGAFSLITHRFSLQKRSIYAGIGGGTEAIAGACAPLVGGLLTDHLSWRWCFYLQLPIVLLTLVAVGSCSRMSKPDFRPLSGVLSQLDVLGTTTFVSAITCLLLATQYGAGKYAWSNWRIMLLFSLFAVMLVVFLYLQHRRQDRAILPPRITLCRNVLFGLIFSSCNNGALSIIEYYMPIYFQNSRAMTATMSGVMLLPIIVGLVISVILSGYLTSIVGYYNPFMIATSVATPIANGLLTTLTPRTKVWKLIAFQGLLGVGAGIGFQSPQVAVQTVLLKEDTPIGLGVIQFAQGVGPAIFIGAAQSIFLGRLKANAARLGLGTEINDLTSNGASLHSLDVSKGTYEKIITTYAESLVQTFYLPVALSCLTMVGALGMKWGSVKSDSFTKTDSDNEVSVDDGGTKERSKTAA